MQLLVVAGFLAVLERNMRKGLALHAERKPFGYLSVTPACAGLGSLVDDLLEQIGASLGECELAEAWIDGSEVGVDDLVESVVLHDVSFHSAWRRVFSSCHSSGRCRKSVSCFSVLSSFFCCAFILSRSGRQCHATIVTSLVYSSVNLEEKVITCEGERPQTRKRKKKRALSCCSVPFGKQG